MSKMTSSRKYNTYDAEFVELFVNSDVVDVDLVSGQENPSVTSHDAEVWRVHTETVTGYVIDVSREKIYEGCEPSGNLRDGTRETRLFDTYKCAMRLGAFVPTAIFGDGVWVLKDFDGEAAWQMRKGEYFDVQERMDVEAFMWDCARMSILGYRDRTPQNMLVSDTGEFRHIDFQSADSRMATRAYQFTEGLGLKLITLAFPPEVYYGIEYRTLSLINHIQETGVIDSWMTDTIRENMNVLEERLPIHDPGTIPDEGLPNVTDDVIPPSVPWSDKPFTEEFMEDYRVFL